MSVDLFGFDEMEEMLEDAQDVEGGEAWVGTAVYYGVFLEFGTSRMEPRPWLQRSIEQLRDDYMGMMLKAISTWTVSEVFDAAPIEIAQEAERRIKTDMGGQDSPAPPGDFPAVDTGNLRASIASGKTSGKMLANSAANAEDPGETAGTL